MTDKRSLRQRIVHAGAWTLGGHTTSQALRLVSNLMMTRLLMPEAFGVMAIANSFLLGLALFSDVGLGQSVVHSKRGGEPSFTNTAWTIQVIRGGLIWSLTALLAGGIYWAVQNGLFMQGSTYTQPVLPLILCTLGSTAFIAGFESTKLASASRSLNVRQITFIELSSQISALLVMIVWAYFAPTIWVLVGGAVAAATFRTSLSHIALAGVNNCFHWDQSAVKEIIGYGKWIFLTSVLGFLSSNADRFLLAGIVSTSTMGLYAIATYLLSSIQQVYSKTYSSVAFPAFCEVFRSSPGELKKTYYKFRLPIDITSLFAAGILYSSGQIIINILYDDRYKAAGFMLEVLSISLFEIRYGLAGQCFMAQGKPNLLSPIIATRLMVLCLLTPFTYHLYGLNAAIWTIGGSVLATIPITVYLKIKNNIFSLKKEIIVLPMIGIGYFSGLLIKFLFI